jgi:type IV secretion system protein VirB3
MTREKINEDTLFLALTRPAMVFGIPIEAFAISCGLGGLAMIVADSIAYLSLALPLLALARLVVERDANAFQILFRWLDTNARCRNRSFWGGSSCSPLRLRRRYLIEEID